MKKILLLLLTVVFAVMAAVSFSACSDDGGTAESTGPEQSQSDSSSTAVTSGQDSNAQTTDSGLIGKLEEVSEHPKNYDFKNEALALMKLIIDDYFNMNSGMVLNADGNVTTLWGVGSFTEAVAEIYKMFPDDEEIKTVYDRLLNRCIPRYRVPVGTSDRGIQMCYYNASAGNKGDYYYDDDLWIAIQFMEAYINLGEEKYLKNAESLLEFIWSGWGKGSGEDLGYGGIPWKVDTGPLTCSNAPAAYAFARYYQLTGDEVFLERAKTVYAWVREYLFMPTSSLYMDGPGNNWSGSYNNGLMIAAGSVLYSITGESSYYDEARRTAHAAFGNNFDSAPGGMIYFANDIDNPWMDAWLVKGYVEFYKIDRKNSTSFLDAACTVMANSIKYKLDSGYFNKKLGADGQEASTDVTHLGGCVTLLGVLNDWAYTYGSNYQ